MDSAKLQFTKMKSVVLNAAIDRLGLWGCCRALMATVLHIHISTVHTALTEPQQID